MPHSRHRKFLCVALRVYGALAMVLIAGVADAPGDRHEMCAVSTEPVEIPSAGDSPYIVINVAAGHICLRTADSVYLYAPCSAGSGAQTRDPATGRVWSFSTPPGVYSIIAKAENPLWHKPDWAFLEEGVPIPENPAERLTADELGDYSLKLGRGLYIHGTLYTSLLGMNVTHGCIRVGDDALSQIYRRVDIGTPVFIF